MYPAFVCFLFWFFSIILETTALALSEWFQPSLYFVTAIVFSIHWRGPEGYFIAPLLGVTADCFSTLPFGIYGFAYFILSFPMRWYSIKIYQEDLITLPFVAGIFTLIMNMVVFGFLKTFFSQGELSSWFGNMVFNEVIPSAILAIPILLILRNLEKRFKIHLSERKF